eukprot:scaffold62550_cov60-Phaeocystis_antarctica.AAC.1
MSCGEAKVAQVGSGSRLRLRVAARGGGQGGRVTARCVAAVRGGVVRLARALLHAVVVRRAGGQDGARLQP